MAQNSSKTITYADAGVNIDQANRTKQRIKYLAHKTFTKGVLSEIGGFGGLFAVDKTQVPRSDPGLQRGRRRHQAETGFRNEAFTTPSAPTWSTTASTILRFRAPRRSSSWTISPSAKLDAGVAEKVVEGLAEACKHNGCALIGGETAEMPGFYPEGEYDLAGFIVGVVEREKIVTGKTVEPETSSLACLPPACTPTATHWPASCSSRSRNTSLKLT